MALKPCRTPLLVLIRVAFKCGKKIPASQYPHFCQFTARIGLQKLRDFMQGSHIFSCNFIKTSSMILLLSRTPFYTNIHLAFKFDQKFSFLAPPLMSIHCQDLPAKTAQFYARQSHFKFQLVFPKIKISTLPSDVIHSEVVDCCLCPFSVILVVLVIVLVMLMVMGVVMMWTKHLSSFLTLVFITIKISAFPSDDNP